MKIKTANLIGYGKFLNKKIEFSEGLNIVFGENESGKSTICDFLIDMFFGGTKPESARAIYTKNYYKNIPWVGDRYEGSMEIEENNRNFHIYRNFLKGKENLEITDIETGNSAKDLFFVDETKKTQEIGKEYFGVTESTIRNYFLIRILNSKSDIMPLDIKDKLRNEIFTDDEMLSLDEIYSKVRKYTFDKPTQEELKYLKKEKSKLENKLNYLLAVNIPDDNMEKLNEILKKISSDENKLSDLKIEIKKIQNDLNANYKEDIDNLKKEIKNLKQNSKEIEYGFNQKISDLYEKRAALINEIDRSEKIFENGKRNLFLKSMIFVFFILFLCFFLDKRAAISFLVLPFIIIFHNKKISKLKNGLNKSYLELDKISEILFEKGFSADFSESINENIENSDFEYIEFKNHENEFLKSELQNKIEISDKIEFEIFKLREEKTILSEKIENSDRIETKIRDTKEKIEKVEARISEIERLKSDGNLIIEILEKISRDNILEKKKEIMELAGEYFSKITSNKYGEMKLDEDKKLSIFDNDFSRFIDVENLSSGTIEQAYLSFKLAAIENLNLDFPVLIDDGLTLYDEERNIKTLKLLSEISKKRQIITFTSKKRVLENEFIKNNARLVYI